MTSIPKLSYLKNSFHHTCKKTNPKKKMLEVKRATDFATGRYIDNLCTVPLEVRTEYLNKMVDAKFKPLNLKNIMHKTLQGIREI